MNKAGEREKEISQSTTSVNLLTGKELWLLIPLILLMSACTMNYTTFASWEFEATNELYAIDTGGSLSFRRTSTTITSIYTQGKIEDYPSQISKALFWPYTSIVDLGTGIRGQFHFPYSSIDPAQPPPPSQNNFGNDLDNYQDETYLLLDLYHAQEYGEDYPIGNWGGSSQVRFDGTDNYLEYWLNDLIVNYGGFSYEGIFLLQKRLPRNRLPAPTDTNPKPADINGDGGYGTGLELSISGTKFSGVSLVIENWFGMEENPLELAGFEVPGSYGSGYFITGDLGYQGTKIITRNLKLGPVRFENETSLDIGEGFNYSRFSTELESENLPIEISSSLTFTSESKAIDWTPSLVTEWACFEVGTEFEFPENNNSTVETLSILGFELTEVQLGNVELDFVSALTGNLQKRTDKTNLDLHATDYLYEIPSQLKDLTETKVPKEFENIPLPYEETDYNGILTASSGTTDLSVALDFYFSRGEESSSLFDLSLVTGTLEKSFGKNVGFGFGVEMDPAEGVRAFKFTTTMGF